MSDMWLFEIMDLPEQTLRRALPKVSSRMLARLVCAYPRAAGRPLMEILMQCMSKPTLIFLEEEIHFGAHPTVAEIRLAEAELAKAIRENGDDVLVESFRLAA